LTYKAYLDKTKAKTGKAPEYFQKIAKEKGLTKHSELLSWFKSDGGMGHGHTNAILSYIQDPELAKKKIIEDGK
jgi:hypothetical protein